MVSCLGPGSKLQISTLGAIYLSPLVDLCIAVGDRIVRDVRQTTAFIQDFTMAFSSTAFLAVSRWVVAQLSQAISSVCSAGLLAYRGSGRFEPATVLAYRGTGRVANAMGCYRASERGLSNVLAYRGTGKVVNATGCYRASERGIQIVLGCYRASERGLQFA